ncbi:MAG: 50S ribosomal protein L17 [Bacteroidetes bacterium]|nr:50S ribosomal protein L17 [Bacteroidota bacterium]MBL6943525.1 50S ribosomal protein L17 [Bacteroidales bacterium]
MRHRKSFNHLGRTSSHRKAMLSNMATSLILHKRITTTVAKAKALRGYVEPLITKSKDDTTHSRRVVFSYLKDKFAVTELFRNISGKVAERPGGYTRIIKLGKRLGDSAEMAMIELVDFNELLMSDQTKKEKVTRRRRGGAKGKDTKTDAPVAEKNTGKVIEDTKVEDAVIEDAFIEEAVVEEVEEGVEEAVEDVKEADIETKSKPETEDKKEDK